MLERDKIRKQSIRFFQKSLDGRLENVILASLVGLLLQNVCQQGDTNKQFHPGKDYQLGFDLLLDLAKLSKLHLNVSSTYKINFCEYILGRNYYIKISYKNSKKKSILRLTYKDQIHWLQLFVL